MITCFSHINVEGSIAASDSTSEVIKRGFNDLCYFAAGVLHFIYRVAVLMVQHAPERKP